MTNRHTASDFAGREHPCPLEPRDDEHPCSGEPRDRDSSLLHHSLVAPPRVIRERGWCPLCIVRSVDGDVGLLATGYDVARARLISPDVCPWCGEARDLPPGSAEERGMLDKGTR